MKTTLKKGTRLTGLVERTDFPNRGILHIDGNRILCKNALEGQTVELVVTKAHKGKGEGRLLSVVKPAPEETRECDCPHFGICGSCVYRTFPYEEQCRRKGEQVKSLLFPVAGEFPYTGVRPSPVEYGYRNKMEFSFGDDCPGGELQLGMHRRGSFYDVITVDDCQIVDEDYRRILTCVLEWCRVRNLPYYHKNHVGFLRHLLVRKAAKTGEILIDIVTSSQTPEGWSAEEFAKALAALPLDGSIVGILHTTNDSLADVIASDRTDILYGKDYFTEELLGLTFKITPFSFFQTNSLGAEVLYETVREYVAEAVRRESEQGKNPEEFTVFDLYSGTGTIAQLLAASFKKVIGVEIVEEAVVAARENAARNGLKNCRFLAGDVLKVLDTIEEKPDLIILDPPRDGIHPKALPKILAYEVPYIVYVSCKPTSLARDLEGLLVAGYRPVTACSVDMFPDTTGIETVCLLSSR